MHICLDFIPELLSQPSLEKQVFAVDLVSHLSLHYALPKAMSVARLAVNTLSTLVTGEFIGLCLIHVSQWKELTPINSSRTLYKIYCLQFVRNDQ